MTLKEDNEGTVTSTIIDQLFEAHGLSKNLPLYGRLEKLIGGSSRLEATTIRRALTDEIEAYKKTSVATETIQPSDGKVQMASELSKQTHLPLSCYRTHGPLMGLPFFTTAKEKQSQPYEFTYRDDNGQHRYLNVAPNPEFGQADQRDADILRYVLSKIGEVMLRSGQLVMSVRVTRYELLQALGRESGGQDYKWMEKALDRLASTFYRTNVLHSSAKEGFRGCLMSFTYIKDDEEKIEEVEITLTKAFGDALAQQGAFLAIDEDILKEKSNIRKFLLELIRKQMGEKGLWEIALSKLHERSRSVLSIYDFKKQVKNSRLPYEIEFRKSKVTGEQIVKFKLLSSTVGEQSK